MMVSSRDRPTDTHTDGRDKWKAREFAEDAKSVSREEKTRKEKQ